MEKKTTSIKAILNTDLDKLLKQTKQYNAFVDGELRCIYCGAIITIDNLSIIIPTVKKGNITLAFCCDNTTCLTQFREEHE